MIPEPVQKLSDHVKTAFKITDEMLTKHKEILL